MTRRGSVLAVTGTSTDVGKTVATAALAVAAQIHGDVGVCKPAQTGVDAGEPGDLAAVVGLAGPLATAEGARYPDPLAPETAARRSGLPPVDRAELATDIDSLATTHVLTLVEGAGGVLVRLAESLTILDLAADADAGVVIVVPPGLGALNHAELTVDAIRTRGLRAAGLVIGWWPDEPDLAMRCNRDDLPRLTGVPVVGVIPDGAGALDTPTFRAAAPGWIDSAWLAAELAPPAPDFSPTAPALRSSHSSVHTQGVLS